MLRKFLLAWLPVAACVGNAPARAAPNLKTVGVSGTAQTICKIGSGIYAVSVVITKTTGANRSGTAKIDGVTGNVATSGTTSATQSYAAFCNNAGGKSLTLSAPRSTSGANVYNYSVTVKDSGGTTVATANTSTANPATASVPIPQTSANYSVTVTATAPPNNTSEGTYTATLTIQTGL